MAGDHEKALMRAERLLTEALDLIDGKGTSAEAAAYLELALQELRKTIRTPE